MNNTIEYDHDANLHTAEGALAAFEKVFADRKPTSLLDVGCGTGTWLQAALQAGVTNIMGVEGIEIPPNALLFPVESFLRADLTCPLQLGRHFDAVLCLEVGEHLEAAYAGVLVRSLVTHGDLIIFSAACPGQPGQHHVNCQWPAYWQELFNEAGFVCNDDIRWKIWGDPSIEPWYQQNIFSAHPDPGLAGKESRLPAVIHPEVYELMLGSLKESAFVTHREQIEQGRMPAVWYLLTPIKALLGKASRAFGGRKPAL